MKIAVFLLTTTCIAPGVFARLDGNIAKTKLVSTPVYKEVKVKQRYLDADYFDYPCDFSELTPNDFDPNDLYDSCRLNVSSAKPINVFNSSNIKSKSWRDDPDLGSPNRKCNPSGPGRGVGGIPGAIGENCDPLGNLLILQNPAVTNRPNDDARGGCIFFDFSDLQGYCDPPSAFINDFGLLDIEEGATIKIYDEYALVDTFNIPAHTVGNNGHWMASKSMEWSEFIGTLPYYFLGMEVCLNGSGAVSFIDYSKIYGSSQPPNCYED